MTKIFQLFTVLLIAVGFSAKGISQDVILTMSGKVIPCEVLDDTQTVVKYIITTKRNKVKQRLLHKSEIFSIFIAGEETVYYSPDEFLGDSFTVKETRVFIAGEGDGEDYNTKRIEALGYVLGAGSGYLSKANIIVLLITPTLYTIYQYIPYIKVKEETITNFNFKGNDIYLRGYEITARGKRVRKALKSSVIGSLVGAIVFRIIPYS